MGKLESKKCQDKNINKPGTYAFTDHMIHYLALK